MPRLPPRWRAAATHDRLDSRAGVPVVRPEVRRRAPAAVTELGDAALAYAAAGLAVFPLKPRSKEPATLDGFKSATTDADRIAAWLQRWPAANVAIRTGRESGIVVLDVDVQHGGAATLRA